MRPPAPGLFSMITGCPMFCDSFCPTSRAKRSLPPPAAKPTIKRIGLLGKIRRRIVLRRCRVADDRSEHHHCGLHYARFEIEHRKILRRHLSAQRLSHIGPSVKCVDITPARCPGARGERLLSTFDVGARRVLGSPRLRPRPILQVLTDRANQHRLTTRNEASWLSRRLSKGIGAAKERATSSVTRVG